jgi:hypothetical protein
VTPDARTPIQRALHRKQQLFNERSSWMEHWREISRLQAPRAGRYVTTDRNKGGKKHNDIIDNTAIFAARTLQAGMMSGMTSPARPWFRLGLADKDMMEAPAVKHWLHETAQLLRNIFAASNLYNVLHTMYGELGLFGTAATVMLPDYQSVIRMQAMTVGEYMIATDHRGRVNTLCREFQMTAAQMVEQFGYDRCSQAVRSAWDARNFDSWFDVVHLIEPRATRNPKMLDARNMAWSSCYFEPSQSGGDFLLETGFKRFPALVPRWDITGNDIYGQSPGMECLGDVKQLQHQQLRKGQGIDYQVNPPLVVPSSYAEKKSSRLPGGIMYADGVGADRTIRTAFEVQLNLQHLTMDIEDVRGRIRAAYYADLFLMLANDTRSGITATEVAERHEEKLLMLGPVLERLHNELLSPLIDNAFDTAAEAGIIPPAPPEMEGMDIEVEYISTLAQAQRMVQAQSADRLVTAVGNIAAAKADPAVWDKVDTDQVIDDYADMLGVPPRWIVSDDQVAEVRSARAQAAAAQQAQIAAESMTKSAANAARVPTQGGESTMATDILNMFQGYNSPSAIEVGTL